MKPRIANRPRRRGAIRILIVCLAFTQGCTAQKSPEPRRPSVVLVSIDTLRADRVGARGLTPSLDRFASKAVRFTSAWSHVPLTLPSHASLLTGLLPTRHGVRDNLGYEVSGDTLATRFKRVGYATGAFVSSTVLRRETGVGRDFEVFDDAMPSQGDAPGLERRGSATVERALSFVNAHRDRPFFLFVHLYDPHTPYDAPAAFNTRSTSEYDREVAAADAAVGTLFDGLSAAGVQAAIAVTADHGEGLGDHGETEHGLLLYSEQMRVPLLIASPDGTGAGRTVPSTVRHVDIPATLLGLAGLDPTGMDGEAIPLDRSLADRPAYSETWYPRLHFGWSELAAVTDGKWRRISGPRPETYDLEADPGEMRSLAEGANGPPVAAMDRFLEATRKDEREGTRATVSEETEERLRSLGYLGSAARTGPRSSGDNPRDKLGFYQPFMDAFNEAHAARGRSDFKTAARAFRRATDLVRTQPGLVIPGLNTSLGDALGRSGDATGAEAAFKAELRVDPNSAEARTGLGTLLWSVSRDAEARKVISGIVEANPRAGADEYAKVIRAFEVLGDQSSAQAWRARANSKGF
jgi:choline-sulfatase